MTSAAANRGGEAARCKAHSWAGVCNANDALWCVCVICNSAIADDEPRRLSDYSFANESWNIRSVYEPDTGVVTAIVAVAKPEAVIGDNLNVVMFIRDGNQWEAWSWANATRVRGIYSAKCILHISDEDDPKWELDGPLPWLGEDPVRPPTPYMAGMLTDDPLFEPVMNSENPAALVSMLADIGYPVATAGRPVSGGGEGNPPCPDEDSMLVAMSDATEFAFATHPTSELETLGLLAAMSSMLRTCQTSPCMASTTPWVVTNIPSNCGWFLIDSSSSPVMGGRRYDCTYQSRRYYRFLRTRNITLSDCTSFGEAECAKIAVAGETLICSTNVDDGSAFTCPATSPSCANSSNPSAVCSAPPPAAPQNGWGPLPCP